MALPNIDDAATKFAKQVNDALIAYRTDAAKKDNKKPEELPELKVKVSNLAVTKVRKPKEQAEQIVKGVSWTCSSAHMSDNARHVDLSKAGKYVVVPSKDLTADEFKTFKDAWNAAMKANGLLNYKAKDGYDEGDAYHLELPDAKLPVSDKRVQECLEEYADMTRNDGKKKNVAFEKDSTIKKWLDDWEKKNKK
jgi:predicted transcriptional regulator YdeE